MLFRRRLLGVLSVLSLVLGGMTVVLWVRSYWRHDIVQAVWTHGSRIDLSLESQSGAVRFEVIDNHGEPAPLCRVQILGPYVGPADGEPLDPDDSQRPLRALVHFAVFHRVYSPAHYLVIHFPHWALCVLSSIPFTVLVRRRAARRARLRAGLCPACGYDLRATPGRCSECGWREAGEDAK